MKYTEQLPNIEDYYPLYLETGWDEMLRLNKHELETGIKKSFAVVSVYEQSTLVGFGRIISDGVIYAAIYDVMVKPEFKNKGIGSEIIKKLIAKCNSLNIRNIHLFAANKTEDFYKKFGFVPRPSDAPGMKYELTKA